LNKKNLKKIISAFVLGAFAISLPLSADAKRIHDPKVSTKSEVRQIKLKNKVAKFKKSDSILRPETQPPEMVQTPRMATPEDMEYWGYNLDAYTPANIEVPETVSVYDTSIMGTPMATQEQCVRYLLNNNPNPNLPVSAEEIVSYYYEEGEREGIRPDVAFAQALKETGFFRYGGDVIPEQNNYCGLGTTGGGVKGEFFATPQMGVRAHIQHLLAYSSTRKPLTPVIDPRYYLVREAYGDRILGDWQDLNGRWAVPGKYYGQEILSMFKAILVQ
jgi:hypothetical protein